MTSATYELARGIYHRIKRFAGSLSRANHALKPDVRIAKRRIGTYYGGWVIAPDALRHDQPIVYSFGLGEDISFDLAMIREYGAIVHGFDPSPTQTDWANRSDLPKSFHFHNIGLADRDGTLSFGTPTAIGQDDYSVLRGDSQSAVKLSVARLETLMRDIGHTQIDIVKMDIEGAEFDALRDIIASIARPAQLLIEFHYLGDAVRLTATMDCVAALRRAGYLIFDVAPLGREISLIHQDVFKTLR